MKYLFHGWIKPIEAVRLFSYTYLAIYVVCFKKLDTNYEA